ncbi:cytidine deaminase [Hymenobacter rubripertinctus]|uniref:Cytidine deaminase n=1 Tax=Hymenobacter rubripertinctus TaxID=2029981 RepID=A0A418R7Y8_9BACT|nr:cytidine deaminase [Hymenobacter rubripertinctus]RIY13411.1 cytidine deaminase [Hymenobacter rubripertinctus]
MAHPLHLTITVDVVAAEADLSPTEAATWQAARAATDHAYAPYSHFHVGAVLLLDDGTYFRGTNQENAAFPSGLCAERTALFGLAASQPERRILGMAIAARPAHGEFVAVTPCGACRQVMAEYEHRQQQAIPLLLPGPEGSIYRFRSLSDLLPFGFSANDLPQNEAVN